MRMRAPRWIRPVLVSATLLVGADSGLAQNIQGQYQLYDGARVVGSMTVFSQSGPSFSIGGEGWSGTGRVQGGSGYYDWRFTDGKSGRTTFTVGQDGTVSGYVSGSGLDWHYVARRISAPPGPAAGSCITVGHVRPVDESNYLSTSNGCDRVVQLALCVRYVKSGNKVVLGAAVPARGSADISLGRASLGDVQILHKAEDRAVPCS
jgi:hypothetical protein